MSSETLEELKVSPGIWVLCLVLVVALTGFLAYRSLGSYQHASKGKFVSSKACQKCHPKQYESWSQTRMARSFEVLRPNVSVEEKKLVGLDPEADYTRDSTCLPCHTTGYGMTGGFVSIEKTPEMAGVTCEACHGAGGMYVEQMKSVRGKAMAEKTLKAAGLVYPPRDPVCRHCHNEKSPFVGMDYVFDYSERLKAGTHQHYELIYQPRN
jgi:hypothetical protein